MYSVARLCSSSFYFLDEIKQGTENSCVLETEGILCGTAKAIGQMPKKLTVVMPKLHPLQSYVLSGSDKKLLSQVRCPGHRLQREAYF